MKKIYNTKNISYLCLLRNHINFFYKNIYYNFASNCNYMQFAKNNKNHINEQCNL